MDLHHVHVFASDIEATIQWWSRHLGAKVFLMKSSLAPEMCFWQWGQADYIYDQVPERSRPWRNPSPRDQSRRFARGVATFAS